MNAGWVSFPRSFLESPIMGHDGLCRLWVYCQLRANWKPGKWLIPGTLKEIIVPRGAFITGRESLYADIYPQRDKEGAPVRHEWKPTSRTLWRWLVALEQMKSLKLETVSNRCTLVTVCDYDTYQPQQNDSCPADVPLMSSSCPADVPLMSTIEQSNKETRKQSNKETLCSEAAAPPSEPALLVFPCIGKGQKTWGLLPSLVNTLTEAYPGIDVLAEARTALAWIETNPTKRKTPKGLPAFLNSWMSRAQNSVAARSKNNPVERDYDPDQPRPSMYKPPKPPPLERDWIPGGDGGRIYINAPQVERSAPGKPLGAEVTN